MTPVQVVYDAFLAKIEDDDWSNGEDIEFFLADWEAILNSAIVYFKFPRKNLSLVSGPDGLSFADDLEIREVQILATLMKIEWLNRTIETWENVKILYEERDFSPGNLLDKFIKLLSKEEDKVKKLQKLYSRTRTNSDGEVSPYSFGNLAGGVRDK